jgi:hypothetical protein
MKFSCFRKLFGLKGRLEKTQDLGNKKNDRTEQRRKNVKEKRAKQTILNEDMQSCVVSN